jgi:hypothetical protein
MADQGSRINKLSWFGSILLDDMSDSFLLTVDAIGRHTKVPGGGFSDDSGTGQDVGCEVWKLLTI